MMDESIYLCAKKIFYDYRYTFYMGRMTIFLAHVLKHLIQQAVYYRRTMMQQLHLNKTPITIAYNLILEQYEFITV